MAAGADALDEEFPPFLWKVVLGALGDKKLEELVATLAGITGEVFAVTAPSERGIPSSDVAAAARAAMPDRDVHDCGSVADGVHAAMAAAGEDGAILVTGSMYVVGEARTLLANIDRS
jgi:folylpolyglutamate synthase/dihydropteroate synthase